MRAVVKALVGAADEGCEGAATMEVQSRATAP